jgi:hypothetical protein
MKAEELISLASAPGVDLVAAAQSRSNFAPRKTTITRQRLGLRITQLVQPPSSGAHGKESPSFIPPEWSSSDAAFALAGLDAAARSPYPALAAFYAWAGHTEHYHRLLDGLVQEALQIRRQENWPIRVRGAAGEIGYIGNLCRMVLDDDRYPGVLDYAPEAKVGQGDRRGEQRAQYCDVTLPVWRSQLADRYSLLRGVWTGWLDTAARWVQRRLREDDDA